MKKLLLNIKNEKEARGFSLVMLLFTAVAALFRGNVNVLSAEGAVYVLSCAVFAVTIAVFSFFIIKESKDRSAAVALLTLLFAEAVFLLTGADPDNFRLPLSFSLYLIAMWQLHKSRTVLSCAFLSGAILMSPSSIMMLPAAVFSALNKKGSAKFCAAAVSSVSAVLLIGVLIADKMLSFGTLHEAFFGDFSRMLTQTGSVMVSDILKYLITVLPIIVYITAFFSLLMKSNRNIVKKASFIICTVISAVMLIFWGFGDNPTLTGSFIISGALLYIGNEDDCLSAASEFFAFLKKNMLLTACAAAWCILFYLILMPEEDTFLLSAISDYFSVNP